MTPIDIRNTTYDALKGSLRLRLIDCFRVWCAHGPGTTRAVAAEAGWDLLSLRPRTTDLYDLGLVELVGHQRGEGGIYRARDQAQWEAWHQRERPTVPSAVADTPIKI